MKAVIKRPGTSPRLIDIENTLEALQEAVGGYIECVNVDHHDVVICNEEGRLMGLPKNCLVHLVPFVGTILIVGADEDDFTDVHEPEYWLDYLDLKENQWI